MPAAPVSQFGKILEGNSTAGTSDDCGESPNTCTGRRSVSTLERGAEDVRRHLTALRPRRKGTREPPHPKNGTRRTVSKTSSNPNLTRLERRPQGSETDPRRRMRVLGDRGSPRGSTVRV